jgi:Uma2 family endonuclease
VRQYLAAGAKAVWVLYPKTREAEIFRADGTSFVRREHETVEDASLFPGLVIDLKAVFER